MPNRPLKPSSRSAISPRYGQIFITAYLAHLVALVLRVFHISQMLRMKEVNSLSLTKVSPQMSPLSTQPTHWQHNQGAITPSLSLIGYLVLKSRRVPSPLAFLSEKVMKTDAYICDQKEGTCGLRSAPFGWHCLSFTWAEEWL